MNKPGIPKYWTPLDLPLKTRSKLIGYFTGLALASWIMLLLVSCFTITRDDHNICNVLSFTMLANPQHQPFNWMEGTIDGPDDLVQEIRGQYGLK